MKKSYLLPALAALIIWQPSSHAQIAQNQQHGSFEPSHCNTSTILNDMSLPGAKTTTSPLRLIAKAHLICDNSLSYVPFDSFTYVYSGNRGATFRGKDFISAKADVSTRYRFPSGTIKMDRNIETYDIHNNSLTNTNEYWASWINDWRNSTRNESTYDGTGKLETRTGKTWDTTTNTWTIVNRGSYTYTASGKVATEIWETRNATTLTLQNSVKKLWIYDAALNNTSVTWYGWNGSDWYNSSNTIYTYDATGNILTELRQSWYTGGWIDTWLNQTQYTNTYDASGVMTTRLEQDWDFDSNVWVNSILEHFSGYAGVNPGVIVRQFWHETSETFKNADKLLISYNTWGLPDYAYNLVWNAGTASWDAVEWCYKDNYYYESYVSSVNAVAESGDNTVIYPCPATDVLILDVTWDEPEEFTACIADPLGRQYRSWTVPSCLHYKETISVADLPAGNYILKIYGQQNKVMKRFAVVR